MSPYTIVLCKILLLESRQRQLGKTAVVNVGDLHCVYRQKDNRIQTGSLRITFFEEPLAAVHSNEFPYFVDLHLSSSLYRRYSSRAGPHNSV